MNSKELNKDRLTGKLADFFAILGDQTRMEIISILRDEELNVTEISEKLNLSMSAVSHQLKILKTNDLVRTRRDGKYIFYYLSDYHVINIFDMGMEHLLEK